MGNQKQLVLTATTTHSEAIAGIRATWQMLGHLAKALPSKSCYSTASQLDGLESS